MELVVKVSTVSTVTTSSCTDLMTVVVGRYDDVMIVTLVKH